jgi:hypothetical protein
LFKHFFKTHNLSRETRSWEWSDVCWEQLAEYFRWDRWRIFLEPYRALSSLALLHKLISWLIS